MTLRQRGLAWLCLALLALVQVWAAPLNPHILHAVQSMPTGGGYASDRAAEVRLARSGIVWQQRSRQLVVAPREASPSFCSAACYMALLRALGSWEAEQGGACLFGSGLGVVAGGGDASRRLFELGTLQFQRTGMRQVGARPPCRLQFYRSETRSPG